MPARAIRPLARAAVLPVAAALPAAAADPVTFQLDWLPGGDKSAIYVCIEQGFCAEEGLDVMIASGRGLSDAVTKLATGASDIGVADIGALMAARAEEQVPVTAVLSIFNKGPRAFYFPDDAGVATVADVKGRKIAPSPFTSSNVFLPLVLADAGSPRTTSPRSRPTRASSGRYADDRQRRDRRRPVVPARELIPLSPE